MDTIKAVAQAVEPINTVPREFWYAATLILVGVVVYFIKDFLSGLKATLKELSANVNELTTLVKLHDKDIKENAKDIEELRKRRRN